MSRRGLGALAAAATVALGAGWVLGDGGSAPAGRAAAVATPTGTVVSLEDLPAPTATPAQRTPEATRLLSDARRASFDRLADSLGGTSGLAVADVGAIGRVERVGPLRSDVAWSTAKTAVAMAVVDAGLARSAGADLDSAITASDNAAAQRLWERLGGGAAAASATREELVAAGDSTTVVPAQASRSGFTAFGQTRWSLADQARFAGAMRCRASGRAVLRRMRSVQADQRWGLGTLPGRPALKGGWGPDPSGAYLVRQMGVVRIGRRPLAVAMATRPADGSFATGIANLDAIAAWLAESESEGARTGC